MASSLRHNDVITLEILECYEILPIKIRKFFFFKKACNLHFVPGTGLLAFASKGRFRRRISHVPNIVPICVDSNY